MDQLGNVKLFRFSNAEPRDYRAQPPIGSVREIKERLIRDSLAERKGA
jgi:hypothetical protein